MWNQFCFVLQRGRSCHAHLPAHWRCSQQTAAECSFCHCIRNLVVWQVGVLCRWWRRLYRSSSHCVRLVHSLKLCSGIVSDTCCFFCPAEVFMHVYLMPVQAETNPDGNEFQTLAASTTHSSVEQLKLDGSQKRPDSKDCRWHQLFFAFSSTCVKNKQGQAFTVVCSVIWPRLRWVTGSSGPWTDGANTTKRDKPSKNGQDRVWRCSGNMMFDTF